MIKTTYFDEDYRTVDESDAKFILQSIFDDDGNLIKSYKNYLMNLNLKIGFLEKQVWKNLNDCIFFNN